MKVMLTSDDVSEILQVSESQAYNVIRRLNGELSEKGFFVQRGRVPKRYFYQRYHIEDDMEE